MSKAEGNAYQIRIIDVRHTTTHDKCLQKLAKCDKFPYLTKIYLKNTEISSEGISRLISSLNL
jgi:hypothetical protein